MAAPNDDIEMEKIAEDELSKLQRQFRVMELDRATVTSSVQPTLRVQRNMIRTLTLELDNIITELRLTKSTSNLLENARVKDRLILLLKEHEKCSTEVKEHRATINELNFLLKQVQREIKGLRAKGVGFEKDYAITLTNQTLSSQLENRLNTAMKKFNSVNSDNFNMRIEIDRLLRDRPNTLPPRLPVIAFAAKQPKLRVQFFNSMWRGQIRRLMEGKARILELVEAAIATYEQREEWCGKLDALKEKAALDYRKHCLEVRELQRQLDHSLKLEEFLRTKGTVRLTAADAREEARRIERQENEIRVYNNYVNILDAIKEYTGEEDVDKLIQEFIRREEENYALFTYINEVNTELKHLSDNVKILKSNIEEEHAKQQAKLFKQQESADNLRADLHQRRLQADALHTACQRTDAALRTVLDSVRELAVSSECDSLPLLKLLGKSLNVNTTNVRLYIKSLEKKVVEMVEQIKFDESVKSAESKERTPPASRRRRRNQQNTHTPPAHAITAHS